MRFGLPRLPHGVAHQIMAVSDRDILTRFVTLAEVGLYSVGASFAMAMELFLSAFEYAWAPFYFATKEPDAKRDYQPGDDLRRGGAGAAGGRSDGGE